MEVKHMRYGKKWWRNSLLCCVLLLASANTMVAQPLKSYTVKNGRMYVQLKKAISISSLDSFIVDFDLQDLGLYSFLRLGKKDSMIKGGWKVEADNANGVVFSKPFEPFKGLRVPADKMYFKDNPLFPAVNNGIVYGVNRFRSKASFTTKDSVVRFFLRNNGGAKQVMLAGSFNNWRPGELLMKKTDTGWIYDIKLGVGKWWYKFIVDGEWRTDTDNLLAENDGLGNMNSVFYKANVVFSLPGFLQAKTVFLAGSFTYWEEDKLAMRKTSNGWELPVYLAQGTHTYKFIVNGRWHLDEANPQKLPDGYKEYNSVIRLGGTHLFTLNGFQNAKEVFLAGSFNQWRDFELKMNKTGTGWEIPYTIGPGNYEYRFKVDGKWVKDPANELNSENSSLIIAPNYTFTLKAFKDAKRVLLAGDFNFWNPATFAMKKDGDEWVLPVHLSAGKHLYKYIVDGKWVIDPTNKLWEQNEYDTGNSVIWIGN